MNFYVLLLVWKCHAYVSISGVCIAVCFTSNVCWSHSWNRCQIQVHSPSFIINEQEEQDHGVMDEGEVGEILEFP